MRSRIAALIAGKSDWPLYLYGRAGTGKTCAALSMLDCVPESLYLTVEDAIGAVLRQDVALWQMIEAYNLVVLDELGLRSKDSDLEYVAVKRVADARELRPAVYVSNLEPAELLKAYDDRIASRVCCGTRFHLTGRDRRMEARS